MNISTIEEIMNYDGSHVISRFRIHYLIDFDDAKILFDEVKKWLWFCATIEKGKQDKTIALDFSLLMDLSKMRMIDEMWHEFILLTRDYKDFCDNYFGFFIHHGSAANSQDVTQNLIPELMKDKKKFVENQMKGTERQYELIYEYLGENTLVMWYKTLADKYPPSKIDSMKRPTFNFNNRLQIY